jgi:hypothetical protein
MADIDFGDHPVDPPHPTATVFRLAQPQVTERTMRAYARRLGLPGERSTAELTVRDEKLVYAERMQTLTMYRASGGFRFVDRTRSHRDDGKTDLAVDDAVVKRVVLDLLQRARLKPTKGQYRFMPTTALRVGSATHEGLNANERTIDVGVPIQRVVEGVPVEGPGGKIVVYLDQAQELSGIEHTWRRIVAVHRRDAPLRPFQRVIQEMQAQLRDRQGRIVISEVRYGYFEQGPAEPQEFLEPAWVVFGILQSSGGASARRTIFAASALEEPMARLIPPLAERTIQTPRPEPPAR